MDNATLAAALRAVADVLDAAPAATAATAATAAPETAKKPAPKKAATKAADPKHTHEQVRKALLKVKNEKGKDQALEILKNVADSKSIADIQPENFDATVEACNNILAEESDDDDM